MRPFPGDDAFTGRSRSASFVDNDITPLAIRPLPAQMSYFIADERTIDAGQIQVPSPTPLPKQNTSPRSSNYGVESLEASTGSLPDAENAEERLQNVRRNWKKGLVRSSRPSEDDLAGSVSASGRSEMSSSVSPSRQRRTSQSTVSRPFTPLSFGSAAPGSLISSPDSRRNSDAGSCTDEVASQAVVSSSDEDADKESKMMDSGSAPQLVMPSIKMPGRRPFTDKGKNMGRLKVLIAGDSGVGKTSLIKAIVQASEDIVHIDPLSSNPFTIADSRRKTKKSRKGSDVQATSQIVEVYASTRAYPAWWSDLEESRILRKRKSMGDSVLERNLCFVDTPGYGNKTSCLECITSVIDHIESNLKRTLSFDTGESNVINMLSGNGGSQVDLVVYMILHRLKPVDIEYLKRLSHLTNVIPVIAQSDTFSPDQLENLKARIQCELEAANIRPFHFNRSADEPYAPFAVATIPSKDEETMDASLLMSPDYVSPLIDSELKYLVSQIFLPDNVTWLRHSAAKKSLAWRAGNTPVSKPADLYRPLSTPSSSQFLTTPVDGTTSHALARINGHAQREERIGQVGLANWAAELQRSLASERARFDALARSERAVWLTERLGECVQDGTIVPLSQARQSQHRPKCGSLVKHVCSRRREKARCGGINRNDPLGLLQLNAVLMRRSLIALKVVSGFGIIGGLALWIVRSYQGEGNELGIWDLNFGRFLGDW